MNLHVIFTFQIHVITQKIKLLSWNFMYRNISVLWNKKKFGAYSKRISI